MRPLALALATLPVATVAATTYALRPTDQVVGRERLAVIRAAVVVGAYAILSNELLSAIGMLNRTGASIVWLVGLVAAAAGAMIRYRRGAPARDRLTWSGLGLVEWLVIAGLTLFAAGTLLIALVAEPNNVDSQAYHLPKVEQWVRNGSVGMYPTNVFQQAALAPGAEYLLLHLRLLTGGDGLYNLIQWGGALLCALAVSRVAAQLGAGRMGQLASAFLIVSTPMTLLQATSTQTDLVAAAWAACAATLAVDAAWNRMSAWDVPLLGGALGLAILTKSTGMVAGGLAVALWFVARAWRVRSTRSAAKLAGVAVAVAAIAFAINAPFLTRMTVTYGHPLGPEVVRHHAMQRHDPVALVVNAARMAQTATMVPNLKVDDLTARAVTRFARALHVDVGDQTITLGPSFPAYYAGEDEDSAPFPVQVVALTAGLVYCLVRRWRDPRILGYALTCVAVAIGFVATLKWQLYINRLVLPGLATAAPLVGVAVDALARHARAALPRVVATAGLILAVVVAGIGGAHTLLFGTPRPLYGPQSVLTTDPLETRFARSPRAESDYLWAASTVKAAGAHRIGMADLDGYEYPLWLLFKDRDVVSLKSTVPGHPAPSPTTVDAVVCLIPEQPLDCASFVPPGWTVEFRTYTAVALPPSGYRPQPARTTTRTR
ncbi:hypothetical protein ACNTMW_10520 [Planosporangium sp. 12N6]|uniref:hypothetical protein n=1 Tax=Planosporangium spinosum TaxID=3402278 RepID=UPI003CF5508E